MLDLQTGPYFRLAHATRHIPPTRGGLATHPSTIYRWAKTGLRGVRLETIRIGGALCTSLEALQRFCDRLSLDGTTASDHPRPVSRRRAEGRAEKELDRLGF